MLPLVLLAGCTWFAAAFVVRSFARHRREDGAMKPIASRAETTVEELLRVAMGLRIRERLRFYLEQSGTRWLPGLVANVSAGLFFLALAGVSLLLPPGRQWLAFAPAAAAAALPWLYVSRRRKKRLRRFEEQFADSLEFASRALKAGHGLRAALEMVASGFAEPLGGEFRRVVDDLLQDVPTETAVEGLAARVPIPDVEFFVSAVLVHERTGGALGEVLNNLAGVLRNRYHLRARTKAATVHGRTTGLIVSAIPIVAGALMYFVNPSHVLFFLNDRTGRLMLGALAVLQACGYLLVRRLMAVR